MYRLAPTILPALSLPFSTDSVRAGERVAQPAWASGIYAADGTISWNIDVTEWPAGVTKLHYRLKTGGQKLTREGHRYSDVANLLPRVKCPMLVGSVGMAQ